MNSLNVDDHFWIYASMSSDWTPLQKLSHISNHFNLRLCYTPHPLFSSIYLFLCANHCCIIQQLFSNSIAASFVPYSSNLLRMHKPRFRHPKAGGPQGKCSSIFYTSITYRVFQNTYATFNKNSPMSNTRRVISLARTRENHMSVFFFIFHTQYVSTLVETEYRF